MQESPLSLYELNSLVRKSVKTCLPDTYWLQAELSEVRTNYTGHCYVEFVQKETKGNNLIAKARGTIWSNVFSLLKPYFEESTGQAFVAGIKVLVKVSVEFHELYGFSLTVQDIDPTYTLGDMARKRREILKQLEREGVLTLNKELSIPTLPQRIAVISSGNAAGYGDFCNQLHKNDSGFIFYTKLFPAVMQGDKVESSIISALNDINSCRDNWDVVVIIRGGGATSDLSGFDTYELASNCAQFPLPIITGIGHERDDTVIDSVSNTRVKTPTAAAEFLIDKMISASSILDEHTTSIKEGIKQIVDSQYEKLSKMITILPLRVRIRIKEESYRQDMTKSRLSSSVASLLMKEQHRLQLLEQEMKSASPFEIMKKGYSISLLNGKSIKDSSILKEGDKVETIYHKGKSTSIITNIEQ